jgi:hypothetical protein
VNLSAAGCPNSDDSLVCVHDLVACEDVREVFQFVTTQLLATCDPSVGCHLAWSQCDELLGTCYYPVSTLVRQQYVGALNLRYQQLGCFGPVCDCPAPPEIVDCIDGSCQF